ncbi:MAG: hypothetical protein EBU66_13320 [Bacteroidetes bacterium]|nr:hypothetical protein [bacterium]NBP65625.1 hypothetical protein [Bacteroidota bacterium]
MIGLMSCEQVVDIGTLPHEEKIFVEGIITAGKDIEIVFSSTLPPLDTILDSYYDIDTLYTRITDVQATITEDGTMHKMEHIEHGRYRLIDENNQPIKGKPGSTYQLNASWKDLEISAYTVIPNIPKTRIVVQSVDTNDRELRVGWEYLKLYIETESILPPTETWVLSTKIEHSKNKFVNEFFELDPFTIQDTSEYSYIQYGYQQYIFAKNQPHRSKFIAYLLVNPNETNAEVLANHVNSGIIIRTFDKAWKGYIDTQYLGEGFTGIFGGTETGIQWNIKGQGLGMFVGKNETFIPLKF